MAVRPCVQAQRNVEILLLDNLGNPAAGVLTQLVLPEQGFVYQEQHSNVAGEVVFSKLYYTDTLIVRTLDPRYRQETTLLPGTMDTLLVVLQRVSADLPTAEVTANRVAMTVSGDTISFDPKAYVLGNESTLGDLIRRIPELELTEQGEVLYKGEKVSAVLVGGQDVFTGIQRSATGSIAVEHVAEIRIIEDYRGFGDFLSGAEKRVVMDVALTEVAKGKIIGSGKLAAGTRRAHQTEASLTSVTKSRGGNCLLSLRQDGAPALSSRDYANARHSFLLEDTKQQTNFSVSDLLPTGILPPSGLSSSRDVAGVAGYRSATGRNRFSLNLVASGNDRRADRESTFSQVSEPSLLPIGITESEQRDLTYLLLSARQEYGTDVTADTRRAGISAVIEHSNARQVLNRNSEESFSRNIQSEGSRGTYELFGFIVHPRRIRISQKTEAYLSFHQRNDHIERPENSSAWAWPLPITEPRKVTFKQKYSQFGVKHSVDHQHGKWWFYGKGEIGAQAIYSDSNFANRRVWLPLDLRTTLTIDEWKYSVQVEGRPQYRYKGARGQYLLPGVLNLFIRWEESTFNYAQLRISTGRQETATLRQSSSLPTIPEAFTVHVNDANPFLLGRNQRIGIDYFNRSFLGTPVTVLFTATQSWSRQDQVEVVLTTFPWIVRQYLPLKRASSQSGTLRCIWPVSKYLRFSSFLSVDATTQPDAPVTDNRYAFRRIAQRSSVGIPKAGVFELAAAYEWAIVSQALGESGLSFTSQSVELDATADFTTRLRAVATFKYRANRFRGVNDGSATTTVDYPMSLRVNYKIASSKFDIFAAGVDLLNLRPRVQQRATLADLERTASRFNTFPGFFQLGVSALW